MEPFFKSAIYRISNGGTSTVLVADQQGKTMRQYFHPAALAVTAAFGFHCSLVEAADKVAIQVINDHGDDIFVSVYDMNTKPRSKLLSHQRINGFASIPISVNADASGNGHVYWTAVSADPDMRKCGHKDKPGLASDASVHVYAKSDCPAS